MTNIGLRVKKMLNKIAAKIAKESGKDEEIILYGLTILANSFFGYLILLGVAFIFGWIKIALSVALTASAFRIFTGGAHAKTNIRCITNTAVVFNVLAFFADEISYDFSGVYIRWTVLIISLIAIIMILLLAPVDVPEKPINSRAQKTILKISALFLLLIWTSIVFTNIDYLSHKLIVASVLGLSWQLLTLTKFVEPFL